MNAVTSHAVGCRQTLGWRSRTASDSVQPATESVCARGHQTAAITSACTAQTASAKRQSVASASGTATIAASAAKHVMPDV